MNNRPRKTKMTSCTSTESTKAFSHFSLKHLPSYTSGKYTSFIPSRCAGKPGSEVYRLFPLLWQLICARGKSFVSFTILANMEMSCPPILRLSCVAQLSLRQQVVSNIRPVAALGQSLTRLFSHAELSYIGAPLRSFLYDHLFRRVWNTTGLWRNRHVLLFCVFGVRLVRSSDSVLLTHLDFGYRANAVDGFVSH